MTDFYLFSWHFLKEIFSYFPFETENSGWIKFILWIKEINAY